MFSLHGIPSMVFFAYIDPGSGSILLQLILSTIIGVTFSFRQTITKILSALKSSILRKKPSRKD
ncbi:MAG: hypothetical protein HYS56_05255 [Candidatus Omnitrophica bacterium]|nr:hypothetical protein [Candidatus Omnitrophota bacterium]